MSKTEALELIKNAEHILVVQGENPDGDSLASAIAIEEILEEAGKNVSMFCVVGVPSHLRYIEGWDRVSDELPKDFDLTIVVDTASETLLERTFSDKNLGIFRRSPLLVIDHHDIEASMPFAYTEFILKNASATGEVLYELLAEDYTLTPRAKTLLTISILYDTRGLSTESVSGNLLRLVASFVDDGVSLADLDEARMAMNRRDEDISRYKGELLLRAEYRENGLATVDISWEEIEKYSHRYNPAILILDEMRLVIGTRLAIAYKTYPDGKILAKIRANAGAPIAATLAEEFGGGGHPFAAGFKTRDRDFNELKMQVEQCYVRLIKEVENDS